MGLFGGKKIYVASSCYNMAGEEEDRPDYLKTMVATNIIGSTHNASTADALQKGYLNGPGIRLRGFYRWAEDNYNSTIGLTSSGLAGSPDIDPAVVAANLPGAGPFTLQMVRSNLADLEVWAEQWILANHPDAIQEDWAADYDDTTNLITITGGSFGTVSFAPANFDKSALYIYAAYNTASVGGVGSVITGSVVTLAPGDPFPSTTGWTAEGGGVFSKIDFIGNDGFGRVISRKSIMTQTVGPPNTYRIDLQDVNISEWSPLMIFIYKVGSGVSALDALISGGITIGGFFPPIPVRVDNHFISDSYLPDQYVAAKRAYKKLTATGKFDDLVAKLADNENLADIDYVFVVPGVSLNVQENSCRKYLYDFFAGAMATAAYGETAYNAWSDNVSDAGDMMANWAAWLSAQGVSGNPLNGTPEPDRQAYGSAPRNEVRVRTTTSGLGYDTRIVWKSIKEDTGSGLAKVGAKTGELWLSKGGVTMDVGITYSGSTGLVSMDSTSEDLLIYWQVNLTSWKRLTIRGLVHQNYIYKGKYVETKAHEALDDEDESGFIVPIHYDTWKAMSLRDTTQMATASIFIVINSYKVKKQKWYQTGIFKILVFIVIVVIMVLHPETIPGGFAILGSTLATALAITGLMALILTAVVSALAAMILTKLIMAGAVEVFGDRLGSIIGAIVAFLTLQIANGVEAGLSVVESLTAIMNPMSLLALTNAIGNGIVGVIQAGAMGTIAQTQDVLKQYNEQSRSISQLYEQNIGYGRGVIDPTMLLDTRQWFVESGDTFLARTLLTGSEIAELSNTLLSNFSDLTLSTELPF